MRVESWRGDSCPVKRHFREFPCVSLAREESEGRESSCTGAEPYFLLLPSSCHSKDFILYINPFKSLSYPLIILIYECENWLLTTQFTQLISGSERMGAQAPWLHNLCWVVKGKRVGANQGKAARSVVQREAPSSRPQSEWACSSF